MLPFLKKSQEASASAPADPIKRKPDGDEPDYDMLHAAAEDMMSAFESKDVPALAEALRAAFDICDAMPHEEGPHTNEEA